MSAPNSYTAKDLADMLQAAVNELIWYSARKKNLATRADDGRTWAELMKEDIVPILHVIEHLRSHGPSDEQWNEAIEEAARVCDDQAASESLKSKGDMERYRKARAFDAYHLASRIRELKRTDAAQEPK